MIFITNDTRSCATHASMGVSFLPDLLFLISLSVFYHDSSWSRVSLTQYVNGVAFYALPLCKLGSVLVSKLGGYAFGHPHFSFWFLENCLSYMISL
jgi:hypothetical protein